MTIIDKILPHHPFATMIGSLPHHNVDAALAYTFKLGLPVAPQIPVANPREFMIAQALEGLPGLRLDASATAHLSLEEWKSGSAEISRKLSYAFDHNDERDAFKDFEPTPESWSSWGPFLWELQERNARLAKIQLAGPITCQWVLKLDDGSNPVRHGEISAQIYKLVLARAIAMGRALQTIGVQPILFLDEPALYCIQLAQQGSAEHGLFRDLALRELKLQVQALQKENMLVGLHCCSNTDWSAALNLGLNVLSFDAGISLERVLNEREALDHFIDKGGRLAIGAIPTSFALDGNVDAVDVEVIFETLRITIDKHWEKNAARAKQVMRQALLTPACGLALHKVTDAEILLHKLLQLTELFAKL